MYYLFPAYLLMCDKLSPSSKLFIRHSRDTLKLINETPMKQEEDSSRLIKPMLCDCDLFRARIKSKTLMKPLNIWRC